MDYFSLLLAKKLAENENGGGGGDVGLTIDDIIERTNFPETIVYEGDSDLTSYVFAGVPTIKSFTATKASMNGVACFKDCTGLETVSMPLCNADSLSFSQTFLGCESLTSVYLPELISLGVSAFKDCSSLEILVLHSVSVIRSDTFNGCSNLVTLDLPKCSSFPTSSTTFSGCEEFSTLILRNSTVATLSKINVFDGSPFASGGSGGILYVPSSLISSYQSASNWSTILGYANNQIKSIESTHTDPTAPIDLTLYYADGTPIE